MVNPVFADNEGLRCDTNMMEDGKMYQVEFRGHLYGIEKNRDFLEFFEFVPDNVLIRFWLKLKKLFGTS